MSQIPINVKRLKEHAKLPEYATPGSHCFDLRVSFEWNDKIECFSLTAGGRSIGHIYPEKLACRGIGLTLYPNHVYKLPTGLKFEIPYGYGMKVFIRSSLAYRHGMTLVNSVGVIDSDYRDELFVLVKADSKYLLVEGDRIAQGEIVRSKIKPLFREVDDVLLSDSRIGGIGSTGVE
jgi:dUTP pyrophosphatase